MLLQSQLQTKVDALMPSVALHFVSVHVNLILIIGEFRIDSRVVHHIVVPHIIH